MKAIFISFALSLGALHAADPFAENVRTTEPLPPAEQKKKFRLPPGFEIQLVAAEPDLRKPMNMAFDARGRLWLTESREYPYPAKPGAPQRDTIRVLSDFDASGRARKVVTFADGLNIPIGVYPYGDGCIAWSIPNIWFFHDTDGDGVCDKREILFGPFGWERDTHGNQSSFRRGFDGWLYATHGYNNNSTVRGRDGHEISMNSGNTYRMRLDGSRLEQHTWGQVNPFGLAWDAAGNLYSSDCHSAPTYQLLVGGIYPSFGKPHDGLGFAPVMTEHSHGSTAIDGMVYYADDLWPAEFQDNTFIGNVMTSRVNRDRVTFNGSSPKANELDDFVKCDDPWFRPVDNQLGPDGAFYIADFYNRIIGHYEVPLEHPGRDRERGRIWRVVYTGKPLRPAALATNLDGLLEELASPNLTRRLLAQHEIEDRFGASAVPKLRNTARGVYDFQNLTAKTHAQVHALWALLNLNELDDESLLTTVGASDPLLRVHALRMVAEIGQRLAGKVAGTKAPPAPENVRAAILMHLPDPDALVQRCAAEALSAWPAIDNVGPLLDALAKASRADTHLVYVVRKALRDQLNEDAVFQKVAAQKWIEKDERALADVAVAVKSAAAGSFLLGFAQKYSVARATLGEYLKHAARYAPADGLDALAQFARAKFADDSDFQLALFKSVQAGLEQRGAPLTPGLKSWGAELAAQLLADAPDDALAWANTPLEDAPTANPWFVQKRVSADGDKASSFLCSLPPGGESLTGVLRSKPFTIPAKLTFWCAGHDGFPDKPALKKNVVRLRLAASRVIAAESFPPRNDTARKISWNLGPHAGEQGFIEVTDADTGTAYAWLAVGRFEPPVAIIPKTDPSALAKRQQAGADLAGKLQLAALEPNLSQLLTGRSVDAETRAAAARGLVALNPKNPFASLASVLGDATVPAALRESVGATLIDPNLAAARAKLVEIIRAAPHRVQTKLAQALAGSPTGAETLLQSVADGKVPPAVLLDRGVNDKLLAAKVTDASARVQQLTKDCAKPNEELQKLVEKRRDAYKPAKAKPGEGAQLFTKTCAICHTIDGQGGNVGPQLDGIGNRGLERLCEDVLDSNRNVDRAFRTTLITLKDGEIVSGLFRREEGEVIVLADATGKELTVPKKQVAERRESETSLMPENFGELLTPDEFQHLMAFLLSKGGRAP